MNGQSQLKYLMLIWMSLLTFIISANGHSGIIQSEGWYHFSYNLFTRSMMQHNNMYICVLFDYLPLFD